MAEETGERLKRALSVEQKLDRVEQKKDTHVLSEILNDLPSGSRLKVYKLLDDEKVYITAVSAEDFLNSGLDAHEWIKRRFADKKYGSGAYQLELLSSDGAPVKRSTISVLSDTDRGGGGQSYEVIEMRDEAFRKLREASEEKLEVERQKADGSNMLGILQTFMPLIIEKSKAKGTHPLDEVERIVSIANKFSGLQRESSLVEQMMQMNLVRSMFGGGERPAKSFMEVLFEHPERVEMFKKAMGFDTTEQILEDVLKKQPAPAPKSGLDQILEFSGKLNVAEPVLKRFLGVQNQPAKTFVEFLSTLLSQAGPHLVKATNSIVNGMVTRAMIDKGLYDPSQARTGAFSGAGGPNHPLPSSTFSEGGAGGNGEPTHQPPGSPEFVQVFGGLVQRVIADASKLRRPMEPEEFTQSVALLLRKYPDLLQEDAEAHIPAMAGVLSKLLGIERKAGESYAIEILTQLKGGA